MTSQLMAIKPVVQEDEYVEVFPLKKWRPIIYLDPDWFFSNISSLGESRARKIRTQFHQLRAEGVGLHRTRADPELQSPRILRQLRPQKKKKIISTCYTPSELFGYRSDGRDWKSFITANRKVGRKKRGNFPSAAANGFQSDADGNILNDSNGPEWTWKQIHRPI